MSEQQQKVEQHQGLHITPGQVLVTTGTVLTSGVIDVATHFNPAYTLAGLVAIYAAGRLTPDLLKYLVPGSDPQGAFKVVESIANHYAPEDQGELPQDALSKIKRLLHIKTPAAPGRPKDERDERMPRERDEDEEDGQPGKNALVPIIIPRAPAFRDMCHLITKKRLVLCYTIDGPIYGTIEDLLSMAIIGKPGRGKTTALIYYVAMLLKADAEVHVWDPHGSMSELDGAFPGLHYTDDLEDIPDSITRLRAELEERRVLYKRMKDRIKEVKPPLLLLVDELPVIGEFSKSLAKKGVEEDQTPIKLISDFVLQARKWNCYFIGAGQSTDAEILPTRVTENLSSRIAFYCSTRRATMAGIDLEVAKKFLPALKPDDVKGKMIFDCSRLSESILGAIPAITIKDVQNFLGAQPQPSQAMPTIKDAQDITLNDLLALINRMPDVDPEDRRYSGNLPVLRSPVYEQTMVQQPTRKSTPTLPPDLQKAKDAYEPGMSYRELGAKLGIGKDAAGKRIEELKRRKLI